MNIANKMKEGLWQEAMPIDINVKNFFKDDQFSGNYGNINEVIKDTRDVLLAIYSGSDSAENRKRALVEINPVPISKMLNFLNTFEKIVENNVDFLTYPKSKQGHIDMIKNVIKKGSLEEVAVLFAINPERCLNVFKEDLNNGEVEIAKRNKDWLLTISKGLENKKEQELKKVSDLLNFSDEEPKSENDNDNEITKTEVLKDSVKDVQEKEIDFFEKPKPIKDAIENLTSNLSMSLKKIMEDEQSVNNNKIEFTTGINFAIRDSYMEYKKNESVNNWFLDVFLESQYNLLYKNDYEGNNSYFAKFYLEFMPDYSQKLKEFGFNTESVLNDKKLWGIMKVIRSKVGNVDYKIFSNELLPKFLTLNSWDMSEKIEIGQNLVSKVFKDELNFKTRLNLWLDIGGSLTMVNKSGESIVDILQKSKNKMWDKSIIEIGKERNIDLSKNFPYDFEKETKLYFNEKDVNHTKNKISPF